MPTNKKPVDVANSSWLQRQLGQLEGLVDPRRAIIIIIRNGQQRCGLSLPSMQQLFIATFECLKAPVDQSINQSRFFIVA